MDFMNFFFFHAAGSLINQNYTCSSFIAEGLDKEATCHRNLIFILLCVRACVRASKRITTLAHFQQDKDWSTLSCFWAQPCKDLLFAWATTCFKSLLQNPWFYSLCILCCMSVSLQASAFGAQQQTDTCMQSHTQAPIRLPLWVAFFLKTIFVIAFNSTQTAVANSVFVCLLLSVKKGETHTLPICGKRQALVVNQNLSAFYYFCYHWPVKSVTRLPVLYFLKKDF